MKLCDHCGEKTRWPIEGLCSACAPYLAADHKDKHRARCKVCLDAVLRLRLGVALKLPPPKGYGASLRGLAWTDAPGAV